MDVDHIRALFEQEFDSCLSCEDIAYRHTGRVFPWYEAEVVIKEATVKLQLSNPRNDHWNAYTSSVLSVNVHVIGAETENRAVAQIALNFRNLSPAQRP